MDKRFKIMCVNAGSSSLKFKLYDMDEKAISAKTLRQKSSFCKVLTSGIVERIGHDDAIFTIKTLDGTKKTTVLPVKDHDKAVHLVLDGLISEKIIASLDEINGVGNRIVQGGPYFSDAALFNKDTADKIRELIPLDPLHAPAHLTCYEAFKKALPKVGEVAVFDTAFHQTMAPKEYMYALPYEYYEKYKVRRYGAHGTSHRYLDTIVREDYLPRKKHTNVITCHIGSGASVAAIKDGKVVATSMGLTPLAGVMMGSRTGDIDPSCMPYLCSCTGIGVQEMYDIFNKQSGILGISGISNDTRDVENAAEKGDKRALLGIDMYASRIADYIAMYYAKLGHVDMIVCSAGVFENAPLYRAKTFENCSEALGIRIDAKKNATVRLGKEGLISKPTSRIPVVVIPTDEELMIALDTVRILNLKNSSSERNR
jgi:acetate kinase